MTDFTPNDEHSEINIIDCVCCWFDLLGFGKPFMDSEWNLKNDSCKIQLKRIKDLNSGLSGFYALTTGKSLTLNDGAIFNYDIDKSKEHLIVETVYFIDNLINDFESVNYRDLDSGHPGARGIITYGHRYNYSFANTTTSAAHQDYVSYHPKEFQMNTAFSKAYLMESAGSKSGIRGNNLFFDNYLLSTIEKLIIEKHGENSIFKVTREIKNNEMSFTIYKEKTRLIKLKFKDKEIDFQKHGIKTKLYEFIKKESIQDDMAYEYEYRRAVALSQMENENE